MRELFSKHDVVRYIIIHAAALILCEAGMAVPGLIFSIASWPMIALSIWLIFGFSFILVPEHVVNRAEAKLVAWFRDSFLK